MTKTPAKGGLGFGAIGSTAVLLVALETVMAWRGRRGRAAAV